MKLKDLFILFVISVSIFSAMAYLTPALFEAFGRMIDAPRCAIGLQEYCNRNYDFIYN